MRKLIVFAFLIGISVYCHAAPPVAEAPINGFGTPVTIAISSTTLTKVPSSQTEGRMGIFLDVPATNTGRVVGFLGNCTSATVAATIRPIEIAPGNNSSYFSIREDVCLWVINLNTGAASENSHYQEVKQ